MTDPFTADEIDRMAADVDAQLGELGTPGTGAVRFGGPAEALRDKQRKAIEAATGEEALSFLGRFKEAARKDLCESDGILYRQWTRWKDLANKDVLKTFGGILVGMGLSGSALQVAVVAIAVYVLYIGVQAFCAKA